MKKLTNSLVLVVVLVTAALFGCQSYKSKNTPIVLDTNQISKTLEAGNTSLQDTGFMVSVKNKSSNTVKANVTIMASVEQNNERVKDGKLTIMEVWGPQEEKSIFVKYDLDKPFDGSAAYRVTSSIF
jgi:beta-lactam-binding protein with PASTA domain